MPRQLPEQARRSALPACQQQQQQQAHPLVQPQLALLWELRGHGEQRQPLNGQPCVAASPPAAAQHHPLLQPPAARGGQLQQEERQSALAVSGEALAWPQQQCAEQARRSAGPVLHRQQQQPRCLHARLELQACSLPPPPLARHAHPPATAHLRQRRADDQYPPSRQVPPQQGRVTATHGLGRRRCRCGVSSASLRPAPRQAALTRLQQNAAASTRARRGLGRWRRVQGQPWWLRRWLVVRRALQRHPPGPPPPQAARW